MAGRAKGSIVKKDAAKEAVSMLAAGKKPDEIASALSISTATVRRWMKDPEIAGEVNELIREKSRYRVARALQVLEEHLDHPNPWVQQAAARMLMERFGNAVLVDGESDNVIRIEGMPKLGVPDGTIGRETVEQEEDEPVASNDEEIEIDATIS